MFQVFIEFFRYFVVLRFGGLVAVRFAGMVHTRKNYLAFLSLTGFLFILQILSLAILGMDMTLKIYPLLSHLPIAIFIIVYLKKSLLISLTSIFASFLCCQPPRWIATIAGAAFGSASMNHIGYVGAALLTYLLIEKYALKSVRRLMERSVKSCLLFAAMPTFYYVFDYATTVYTDFMYSGTRAAVQFMPFMTSIFYFLFVLLYYGETQKQANIQRELDMIDM